MKKLSWLALPILAGAVVLAGCSRGKPDKEYDVHGQVVKVDREQNTVTIRHDDIPGFAGETQTQFEVQNPRLLANLRPDDEVRGRLHVRSGSTILVRLEKVSSDKDAAVRISRAKLSPEDRKLAE